GQSLAWVTGRFQRMEDRGTVLGGKGQDVPFELSPFVEPGIPADVIRMTISEGRPDGRAGESGVCAVIEHIHVADLIRPQRLVWLDELQSGQFLQLDVIRHIVPGAYIPQLY